MDRYGQARPSAFGHFNSALTTDSNSDIITSKKFERSIIKIENNEFKDLVLMHFKELSEHLGKINQRLDQHDKRFDNLQKDVTEIKDDVKEVKRKVSSIEEQTANL